MADLSRQPMRLLVRCVDDTGRPPGFSGQWPEAGMGYAARLCENIQSGELVFKLDGLDECSMWGFHPDRFAVVHPAPICYN